MRATWTKVKLCEQLKTLMDHSSPLLLAILFSFPPRPQAPSLLHQLIVQSILVYYDSARLMQNLILLLFFFSLHFSLVLGAVFISLSFQIVFISFCFYFIFDFQFKFIFISFYFYVIFYFQIKFTFISFHFNFSFWFSMNKHSI